MHPKLNKRDTGFIKTVIIVIGALVLLKYAYDFDVIYLLSTGKFKIVLDKFYSFGKAGWGSYSETVLKVWEFISGIFWQVINKAR